MHVSVLVHWLRMLAQADRIDSILLNIKGVLILVFHILARWANFMIVFMTQAQTITLETAMTIQRLLKC